MKHLNILLIVFFIVTHFTACKRETLHTDEIIRKHNFTFYPYWDSEQTPFRRNAFIYANQKTDSCMLVLKNKKGDTILCHLDKSIVNITSLHYQKMHNDWIIIKRDYGKTTYDSTRNWGGAIGGSASDRFPLDAYYTIDREKKELKKINLIGKKEFLNKIASKFTYLKNCTIAALDDATTYVFKDTLNDRQVLYQIATKYVVKYIDRKYVVEPKFAQSSRNGIFKKKVFIEKGGNTMHFGEKIFYGKNSWDFNFRYEIDNRKYYKFKSQIKKYNNLPGIEVFKTEIIVYDWKNKTTTIVKNFPKDSLFEDYGFDFQKQPNGKIYAGINTGDDSYDFYYELDTIRWMLTGFKEPATGRIPRY